MSKVTKTASVKFFMGTIKLVEGEREHFTYWLAVALSSTKAAEAMVAKLAEEYKDECEVENPSDPKAQHVISCFGGELFMSVQSVREISSATYHDLRDSMPNCIQAKLVAEQLDDYSSFNKSCTSVTKALKAKGIEVTHSQVLQVMAASIGERTWQQYRIRSVPNQLIKDMVTAAETIEGWTDDTGCEGGYTVTSQPAIDALLVLAKKVKAIQSA